MVPRNLYPSEIGTRSKFRNRAVLVTALMLASLLIAGSSTPAFAQFSGMKAQTIELEATPISDSQIRLNWRINYPKDVTSIRIYRAHYVTPDNFVFLTSLAANTLSFVDSGLKAKATWIYRIQTSEKKPAMLSSPSNVVRVTTLDVPADPGTKQQGGPDEPKTTTDDPSIGSMIQTLSARAISANEIELRWAIPNMNGVSSMRIFRASSFDPKNFIMVSTVGSNFNRYVDPDLKPRTTYYYQIKYNLNSTGARLSPPSNTASATTPDGADPNPRAKLAAQRPKPGILFELSPGGIGSAIPLDNAENDFLFLLNKYRASRGVGPVRASVALTMASDALSKDLANREVLSKSNSDGFGGYMRYRGFGFYKFDINYDTLAAITRMMDIPAFFDEVRQSPELNAMMLRPEWKTVGIGRAYSGAGSYYWVVDFVNYWDKTIPLGGEDTDGRVDGNERVRTRPPFDSLLANARLTGYGDDGKSYSPVHCDTETNECWRDPAPGDNRSLSEDSLPENMTGMWHVAYQINPKGVMHFNSPDRFDMTEFTMSLLINENGTWVSQGYKAYQEPPPTEAGTWKWVHDAAKGEEIVTFFRDNGKQAATFRVHASPGVMTFFVVDGGDFFKGVKGDYNPTDDAQVISLPGAGFFLGSASPFPSGLRCGTCPQP
ncbi:MAG: CAP domain-containing protein [Acidobacteriota bacterium]